MSKRALKEGKRRSKAVIPVLGITGLSLSLASGATASTGEATTTVQQPHELFLGEEEIFDTSLSTFYTFDKENVGANSLAQGLKLARGGGCGCGGCGGHGGGCGGGGGCAARGCGGGGGCAAGVRGCAGGVHVACAAGVRCAGVGRCAGFGVHCRCAFFRRCFGCGCSGCGGCGGCGTCWIWTPGWGWINTCWSESTPAGEEASVATDASSYAPPSPPSSPSSRHRNEETFTVPSESGGTREIKIINRP